ncbi:MAG: hypothetical protein K8R21_06975, partial [Leptospira sp.]|nr:hypothetical protein [Leptospira sp.]
MQKLQKAVTQLENILKTSRNDEQRIRVSQDIRKYREKMQKISPDGMPDNLNVPVQPSQSALDSAKPGKRSGMLDSFPVMKISPNSNDQEINFIGTLVNVLDLEFLPVLGDSHIKLDFSHATERDSVVKHI